MVSILIFDRNPQEGDLIARDCRTWMAKESGEELRLNSISNDQSLFTAAEGGQILHLLYYDFQEGQELEQLRRFRRSCEVAMMMLITDASVSPLEYLRPGVNPDSLLLRPVSGQKLKAVNGEFLHSFFDRLGDRDMGGNFVVDTREEKMLIPYSGIYYFEARDKKLFVRTKSEEYAFYGTIEGLGNQLPETFRRCHRSYIVNLRKIRRVVSADNLIELEGRIGVPISRSYKAAFKELWT